MPERWTMIFGKPGQSVAGCEVKFGGQPDWLGPPTWPVGETLGEPMRFLAQIRLPKSLRVGGHRMAYLFLADHDPRAGNMPYLDDAGDNAVILQGGERFVPNVKTLPTARGPTLRVGVKSRYSTVIDDDPTSPVAEVPVRLRRATEPAPLSEVELHELWQEDRDAYNKRSAATGPSKVGGSPRWLQGPDTPSGGPWRLLAQVDIEHVPCWAPFDGWLFAFVAADGTEGRMLYQIT